MSKTIQKSHVCQPFIPNCLCKELNEISSSVKKTHVHQFTPLIGVEISSKILLLFARNWMKYADVHKFVCHPITLNWMGFNSQCTTNACYKLKEMFWIYTDSYVHQPLTPLEWRGAGGLISKNIIWLGIEWYIQICTEMSLYAKPHSSWGGSGDGEGQFAKIICFAMNIMKDVDLYTKLMFTNPELWWGWG